MMRVILFLCINLSVMFLFSSIIILLGYLSINTLILIFIVGICGLGGALVSLFLSKFIALSSVNGVIINQASNDIECWLLQVIRSQANILNIITPQLAIYNSLDMNAFATGAKRNSALIAVSTGLLDNMSRESIKAVIAHEMNHIVSGDMITMTLIQGIINTVVIFMARIFAQFISYWISFFYNEDNEQIEDNDSYYYNNINVTSVYIVVSVILELLFGMIASIIVFWFSRNREFYADAGAAKLIGTNKIIVALQELKHSYYNNRSARSTAFMSGSEISTLYINNNNNNNVEEKYTLINELFSSHPSLDKRIAALKNGLYLNKSSCFFEYMNLK